MGKFLKLTALFAANFCLILAATVGQTQQPVQGTVPMPQPKVAQFVPAIQPRAAQMVPPKVEHTLRLISPEEFQRNFMLVGACGRPANEIMTLDVEIVEGALKGEGLKVVHVWKINGQVLSQPVRIEYQIWQHAVAIPKMMPKQLYEVRAFEDISYVSGLPTEAYMENNVPVPQAGGSGYRSHLNIIRVLR
jgi:hypothetical protein